MNVISNDIHLMIRKLGMEGTGCNKNECYEYAYDTDLIRGWLKLRSTMKPFVPDKPGET
jgi:hypothetical protein